jgi:hypothetical protein
MLTVCTLQDKLAHSEELSKEYAGKINIYKVDIEQERELASLFRSASPLSCSVR